MRKRRRRCSSHAKKSEVTFKKRRRIRKLGNELERGQNFKKNPYLEWRKKKGGASEQVFTMRRGTWQSGGYTKKGRREPRGKKALSKTILARWKSKKGEWGEKNNPHHGWYGNFARN